MKSIMQDTEECYICHTTQNLHLHHCIHGTANRKLSDKYGLTIYLCAFHHNMGGENCVHGNAKLDYIIKQEAQKSFEEYYPREDFIKIFGRSYISDKL